MSFALYCWCVYWFALGTCWHLTTYSHHLTKLTPTILLPKVRNNFKLECFHSLQWKQVASSHSQFCETMSLAWVHFGDELAPSPDGCPEPSDDRAFHGKFCSVYVVKGVWSSLTVPLLNRQYFSPELLYSHINLLFQNRPVERLDLDYLCHSMLAGTNSFAWILEFTHSHNIIHYIARGLSISNLAQRFV